MFLQGVSKPNNSPNSPELSSPEFNSWNSPNSSKSNSPELSSPEFNSWNSPNSSKSNSPELSSPELSSPELSSKKFYNSLQSELRLLESDLYSNNIVNNSDFKNLRLLLLSDFGTQSSGGFITLGFLKFLFLIYHNENNKYQVLHNIIYNTATSGTTTISSTPPLPSSPFNNILLGLSRNTFFSLFFNFFVSNISTPNTSPTHTSTSNTSSTPTSPTSKTPTPNFSHLKYYTLNHKIINDFLVKCVTSGMDGLKELNNPYKNSSSSTTPCSKHNTMGFKDVNVFLPQNNYVFPLFDELLIQFPLSPIIDVNINKNKPKIFYPGNHKNSPGLFNTINRMLRQFQGNKSIMDFELLGVNNNFLYLNKNISNIIIEYFNKLKQPVKSLLMQEDEEQQINNIYSLNEYLDKFNNKNELIELNELDDDVTNSVGSDTNLIGNQLVGSDTNLIGNQSVGNPHEFYIPDNEIKFNNLLTLLNKSSELNFKFLLTPLTSKSKDFNLNIPEGLLIKTKIKILYKEYNSINEYEKLVSKLKYTCPVCESEVFLNVNDLSTEVVHLCDAVTQKKTKINQIGINPAIQTPVMLYKCEVCVNWNEINNKNKSKSKDKSNKIRGDKSVGHESVGDKSVGHESVGHESVSNNFNELQEIYIKDVYIYSLDLDLTPGFYVCDLVKFYEPLNILTNKNKKSFVYFLLGTKKEEMRYVENKIIKTKNEINELINNPRVPTKHKSQFLLMRGMVEKNKIVEHKLFDLLFSIRQYYKNRLRLNIDNSGFLAQLFSLISITSRIAFNENKIGISIMGVGSVSKTFPCNMIFNIMDHNYRYISDTGRMSIPGLTGGVNNNLMINGVMTSRFQRGAISNNGVVVFDECQSIFLNKEIQSVVKSIPQKEYEIVVSGGMKIEFNATTVFLSNFNEFMNKYEKRIIDAYLLKYKATYKFEHQRKLKTNQDIIKYVSKINLYQNIEFYYDVMSDEILANVIYAVRKQFESERIDWKTGSQIEAMNRILFDTVVHRKNYVDLNFNGDDKSNKLQSYFNENENTRDINLNENMPIQQVYEEVLRSVYYDFEKNADLKKLMKINLNDENKNSNEVIEQLDSLNKSVYNFLTKEKLGMNITKYFIENVDNFDKKIRDLVKKVIKIIQLIDDYKAYELTENTKILVNHLLLKCKRGVIQEEYDWDINVNEIKIYPKLNVDFLVDLEDTRTELYYEEKRKQDLENLESEIESKYGLKKKEEDKYKDKDKDKYIDNDKSLESNKFEIDLSFNNNLNLNEINKLENNAWDEFESKKKEYDLKSICHKLGFMNENEEEMTEFIKQNKKHGNVYEPKPGVFKIN